ncbi:MAG: CoxE, partial [Solirubrobacterales bacterium]|nr:CoxE [Solirubrobacterales bacterium]
MPTARDTGEQSPVGIAARLVEFAAELRREGVGSGTAELLDAVAVLEHVAWNDPADFREALATTLAKSQEDRRVFELVFERFFFRAAEAAAITEGIKEGAAAGGVEGGEGGEVDLEALRRQIAQALRDGTESAMRDLARLAIAAFGRAGQGSG